MGMGKGVSIEGSETILMVDDNESVCAAISAVLEMVGYKVIQASGGNEALQFVQGASQPIHLMIADLVMPHMSGVELSQAMKAIRPETPVLIMTGYGIEYLNLSEHRDFAVIQKPLPISVLLCKIREMLDRTLQLPMVQDSFAGSAKLEKDISDEIRKT